MRPGNADVQHGVTQADKQGLGTPLSPEQRTVEIFGAHAEIRAYDNPVYTRTVTTRPVTFTCAVCARTLTQQRFPGPLPRYCGAGCQASARRALTRARVQRHRTRQRDPQADKERG